jgi:peptidoglycan/xylan/chitin deacetylase (PgdA/CDA1 family)
MRQALKHALMSGYLASGFPQVRDLCYARSGRGRLTVLTYHQVDDTTDDGSTVTVAAFRQQMQFLKKHYRVVPLVEAVAALDRRGHGDRLVAITFDDGYLDNATIAAPILRALDLPASFFVSTDMIGTTRPFPHDVEQGRPPQAHMSWDDLRSLAASGFEIGSHTCSHADLGAASIDEATRELRQSRQRIEDELKIPVRLFSFPYGHPRNMRRDTLAAARAEYEICCEAHGGHNTAPVDRGRVRRIVISTRVTFLAFRALLEGWPMLRLENTYHARVAGEPAPEAIEAPPR